MQILQIASIIAIGLLVLVIHRAGVPRSLRAIGSAFWAAAAAWERAHENFRECMADAEKVQR